MGKSIKELSRAIDIVSELLDDIAYYQVQGSDLTGDTIDRLQTKLSKVYFLLDRSYPEDDYGYGTTEELDFERDETQSSFDFQEEEDR